MKAATDIEQPRTPTLKEQRLLIQELEKKTRDECNAAKEILETDHKPVKRERQLGKSLPNPGRSLKSKAEEERRRRRTLIEQHNGLKFAVRAKESKLLEMEQALRALELKAIPDDNENTYDQRVRQLENSLEKMKIKITEAEKIQSTYLLIREHLLQEVQEMPMVLDQLQRQVAAGQTELGKVAKMSRLAVAAVVSTKGQRVQMEREMMVEKKKMESELSDMKAAEEEVEGRLDWERHSTREAHSLKEQIRKRETEANAVPVRAQQTPQSTVKLVEGVDALREDLSCTDLQELEMRLVSQRETMEQLQTKIIQGEELLKQRNEALADLESQCARLKFTVGPGSSRFEELKEQMEKELKQEEDCVHLWEDRLRKAEDTLSGVQQAVDNLYNRMICVPMEESTSQASMDTVDKLKDISGRLSILQSRTLGLQQKDSSSLDQEKVWNFLEQTIMTEPRNFKRASSPVYDSSSEDTFQFRSHEEDCSLSREEIRRQSNELVEARKPKKKTVKN